MAIEVTPKKKKVRPPRTELIRAQDRDRQKAATERKRLAAEALGMREFKGPIYQMTSDRLAAILAETGCEEIEAVVNLIHRAYELRERDSHAFKCLTSHEPLPEVWHG